MFYFRIFIFYFSFFNRCFGFISKKINGNTRSNQPENECHIFAEIDRTQPSTAIVNFVSKVMIGSVPV
jgi:tensin